MELREAVVKTARENDRTTRSFGKVEVIDSAKVVYLDLRMTGDNVFVDVHQLDPRGFFSKVEIQDGYINGTIQEDLNAALKNKDWKIAMAKEPSAVLTAQLCEDGIRIDDIAVQKGQRRDNYERVLTNYMKQLSKTLGKKHVTAKSPLLKSHIKENSKEAKKFGKDMTFFDKKTYAKYLKVMGFESAGVMKDLSVENGKVNSLHPGVVEVLNQSFKVSEVTEIMQM